MEEQEITSTASVTTVQSLSGAAPANLLPPPGEKRRVDLHRRRAIIRSNRIDVKPSRTAIIPPLFGFMLGAICVTWIIIGVTHDSVPYLLLAALLLFALIAVPLSGITLVYALVGANIIFDREKQSGAWQQGFLGMGIGTTELVPFWKIEGIAVVEAGDRGESARGRVEEFAQWEAVLIKKSGKRLPIAGMPMPRQFARAGIAPVRELAEAVAALTGTPLDLSAVDEFLSKESVAQSAVEPTAAAPAEPAWETVARRRAGATPQRPPKRRRR